MARVLEVEYGGMNDLLYQLYAATGERAWQAPAQRFDHERIFEPLANGRDELKGLHVKTQIPKIIGAAQRYELTGGKRYRDVVRWFFHHVATMRSYATGGTGNGERRGLDPGKLASELSGYTQECCCTYNMLKVARHLFCWTAAPRYADYYERAMFNGIPDTQHPDDAMTLCYLALASGYGKLFGLPPDAFWCCTGTGVESFSKLGDSVYFHDDDGRTSTCSSPPKRIGARKACGSSKRRISRKNLAPLSPCAVRTPYPCDCACECRAGPRPAERSL